MRTLLSHGPLASLQTERNISWKEEKAKNPDIAAGGAKMVGANAGCRRERGFWMSKIAVDQIAVSRVTTVRDELSPCARPILHIAGWD